MINALIGVRNGGLSIKSAALRYGIPRTTLRQYIKKCDNKNGIDWTSPILEGAPKLTPNYAVNIFFQPTKFVYQNIFKRWPNA